jgi:autotransporter-associated beta strand protein
VWSPAAPAGGPTASDNVTIPDQALKALGIDGARSANNFTFLKADAFNVVGGAAGTNSLSIIGDLVKSGGGLLTFRASGSNLLALNVGNLVISNGEVAMGSTSVTLASLDVSGATSLSGSGSALSLNIAEGGTASLGALTMGTGTVVSIRNVSSGTATTEVTSLAGAGIIRNANTGGTGRGILVIESTGSASYGGTIIDNSTANPDSKLEIVKTGSGTQVFTGNNTYTGTTTVTAGSLIINGNQSSAIGVLTVASGATLGGSGTIGGATHISGSLAPGNSIGTLTVANDVTWSGGEAWVFELGSSAPTLEGASTGGSSQDQLAITGEGSRFLKEGSVSSWTFNFAGTGAEGFYQLVTWSGTTTFDSLDFQASNLANGFLGNFTVQDNALYLEVVPEPSTYALLVLASASLGAHVIRRRRSHTACAE